MYALSVTINFSIVICDNKHLYSHVHFDLLKAVFRPRCTVMVRIVRIRVRIMVWLELVIKGQV